MQRADRRHVASLTGAGQAHLTFFAGGAGEPAKQFAQTQAGFCFVPAKGEFAAPQSCTVILCDSVQHAFAATAKLFYPDSALALWDQTVAVHPTAKIGKGVVLAPGVVIGPHVEIGDNTRIGPNTTICPRRRHWAQWRNRRQY
ncbi:MAG: LpxD N-terminal domain-containing protein [Rhizomicrobium sp.]